MSWPHFIEDHGEFDVEGPISHAMKEFLANLNHKDEIV